MGLDGTAEVSKTSKTRFDSLRSRVWIGAVLATVAERFRRPPVERITRVQFPPVALINAYRRVVRFAVPLGALPAGVGKSL